MCSFGRPYSATVTEGTGTRATLDGGNHYIFEAGDKLYVTDATGGLSGCLTISSGVGATSATFDGELTCGDDVFLSESTQLSAVLISEHDRIHTITDGKVASARNYPVDEFGTDLADAVSKFSDFTATNTYGAHSFTVAQQSAFLTFSVSFSNTDVPDGTDITAKVFNNSAAEPIWTAVVTATASGNFTRASFVLAFPGGTTSLTDAELSVQWGNGQEDQEAFSLTNQSLAVNKYYTVSRSTIDIGNPFHIRAKEDGTTNVTFKYTYATGGIQYICYDLGVDDWTNYDGSSLPLSKDYVVYFKGTRTDCNCSDDTQLFTSNKVCYIAGNITSLTNGVLATNAFRSAFSYGTVTDANAENLEKNIPVASGTVNWVDIDSSDPLILPATTAAFCYTEMFMGCSSLHSAPDLPATELADKCYFRMFYNCTSLSSIPTFPSVVTMAGTSNRRRYCFQMFQSCTGITRLEGSLFGGTMTLQANCFEDMFANCTGLIYVDKDFLPATTLAASCYRGMFQNTRFETAPDLLADELKPECYRFMFSGCTNLKEIKCLATQHLGNGYTTNWVGNNGKVNIPNTSECIFVRAGTAAWPRTAHGIPSEWTVNPPFE